MNDGTVPVPGRNGLGGIAMGMVSMTVGGRGDEKAAKHNNQKALHRILSNS